MELRTRIFGKLLNDEVEAYLQENDIIIVPVGVTEMHGGFPLDCETVIAEAYALEMAKRCDGLVLTGLPYFYAGATASGRGTVDISVRQGIDYLGSIARTLLRLGFKRQIYVSFHGPANLTIAPMIRDFYNETGVSILFMDWLMQMGKNADLFTDRMAAFHDITVGAYQIMGRLEDVPFVTGYHHTNPSSTAPYRTLMSAGNVGYCYNEHGDHMSTPDIPDAETRSAMAARGTSLITQMVERANMKQVTDELRAFAQYGAESEVKYPWMPSAWNRNK